jgi:hypothetical protein
MVKIMIVREDVISCCLVIGTAIWKEPADSKIS